MGRGCGGGSGRGTALFSLSARSPLSFSRRHPLPVVARYEYVSYTQRQNSATAWRAEMERRGGAAAGAANSSSGDGGASRSRGPLFPTTVTSGKPVPRQLRGLLAAPAPKNYMALGPYLVYLPAEFTAVTGRGASFYLDPASAPAPAAAPPSPESPLCDFFGPSNFLRSVSDPRCVYNLTDASRLDDVARACDAVAGCEGFTVFTVSGLDRIFMWYNEALFGGPARTAAVEPAGVHLVSDEARVALLLRGGVSGGCLVLAGALTVVRDDVPIAPGPDGGRLRFVTAAELSERGRRAAAAASRATVGVRVGAAVAAAAAALLVAALLLLAAARRRGRKVRVGEERGNGSGREGSGVLYPDDGDDDELGPGPGDVSVLLGRLSLRVRELAVDLEEDGADERAAEEFRRLRERLREWELPLSSIELLERPGPPVAGRGGATPAAATGGCGDEWLLGKGRSGEVYCALLDGLQLVAVKIFVECHRGCGRGAGEGRVLAAQLAAAREIDLLCSLRCPHILGFVGVIFGAGGEGDAGGEGAGGDVEGGGGGRGGGGRGAGDGGSRIVLVTEHVPRGDLAAALLRDGGTKYPRRFTWDPRYTPPAAQPSSSSSPSPPARRLRVQGTGLNWSVAAGICRALAHLHKKGVAHLDLKPANVLLTQAWQPVLCDFGLAKRVRKMSPRDRRSPGESKPGDGGGDGDGDGGGGDGENSDEEFGGTFAFTAPEIFLRSARRTTAADIYSFGVLLWSMCAEPDGDETRGPSFSRGAPPAERPLCDLSCPREAPAEVAGVIKRCLAADPRERPTAEWLALFFADGLEALDVEAGVRGGRAQGENAPARKEGAAAADGGEGSGGGHSRPTRDGGCAGGGARDSSDRRRSRSNTTAVGDAVRRVFEEAAGE